MDTAHANMVSKEGDLVKFGGKRMEVFVKKDMNAPQIIISLVQVILNVVNMTLYGGREKAKYDGLWKEQC